jgi:hypothetical protein
MMVMVFAVRGGNEKGYAKLPLDASFGTVISGRDGEIWCRVGRNVEGERQAGCVDCIS